jgi:hypothetical protein
MNLKMKIAFTCHLLTVITLFVFGLIYFFRVEFMPYHAVAVGAQWSELAPEFQVLFLGLMKVVGGAWIGGATAMALLLFIPFRRGEGWSIYSVPLIGIIVSGSSLYATLYVAGNTPANPPWIAAAVSIVLLVIGFLLSLKKD